MEKIKPILSFIKENFTVLVIAFLILFFWFQGCFDRVVNKPEPQVIIHRDTVEIVHHYTEVHTPPEIRYIPYPVEKIKEVLKDSSKTAQVVADYYATRVQKDSLKIDSIGRVDITISTSQNRVDSVAWKADIKERKITETITIREPYKPRNQVFYGGELFSPLQGVLGIGQAQVGLLFKNKKDNILKLSTGYNFQLKQPQVSLGYYKKF